jgi:REP element-mobilizing transposase RayT
MRHFNGRDSQTTMRSEEPRHPHTTMPQSLSRILVHLVFSTKKREGFLCPAIQSELHPYIVGILDNIDCPSLQVGGTENHIHSFFGMARTRTISDVVEKVKTGSSKWIKTKGSMYADFHWQSGYGAFSVSQSDADKVVAYIRNQPQHHQKMTFQEEYKRFLERYKVAFDERYMWD